MLIDVGFEALIGDIHLTEARKDLVGAGVVVFGDVGLQFFYKCLSLGRVSGVSVILSEMIYNLCDNAIKYNKESGTVDVIINQANGKTSVTVRDTGIGIPASEQNRVFERFYRVDKSHSKLVGGTGLGLAIVKHIIAKHDASMKLESEVGVGTKITVNFF